MIIFFLYEYNMHMFKLSWGVNSLLRRSRHYAATGMLTYGVDVHPSCPRLQLSFCLWRPEKDVGNELGLARDGQGLRTAKF